MSEGDKSTGKCPFLPWLLVCVTSVRCNSHAFEAVNCLVRIVSGYVIHSSVIQFTNAVTLVIFVDLAMNGTVIFINGANFTDDQQ